MIKTHEDRGEKWEMQVSKQKAGGVDDYIQDVEDLIEMAVYCMSKLGREG